MEYLNVREKHRITSEITVTFPSSFPLPTGINPDLSAIKKVLVVVAHPDDLDYGSAGTVATLTKQGIEVAYCLFTSGDAGGDNDGLSRDERIAMREREQSAAAKVAGVTNLHFLKQPDGKLEANLDLREKITRVIRKEKPDLVITQSPVRRYDRIFASHPDHLAAGESTISAVYPDSQNPHAFPHLLDEDLPPHRVKAVWIMADETPDTYVDITDSIETKIEALFQHESQISDKEFTDKMVRDWCALAASEAGMGKGKYAEAYRFVQISF
jgi:LmbE family N-acetylglucosaminyl deacetylase